MEASLQQILDSREHRARIQRQLIAAFQKPLICFTLNIPGPRKTSDLIRWGFSHGLSLLKDLLSSSHIPILSCSEEHGIAGSTAYLIADAPAHTLKGLCMALEDRDEFGRLLDLDVLDPSFRKCSRQELGSPERKCLLCHSPAALCGRSRAHSVYQLQQAVQKILWQTHKTVRSQRLGQLAVKSLLQEVLTTPKPGLVDRNNSGSHGDMDLDTFANSSAALFPYFTRCAAIGMETAKDAPRVTFSRLRLEGMLAEQAMYEATGGVNTHKGAIFILGIFCAAAGRLQEITEDGFFEVCKAMTLGLTKECGDNTATIGQRLYRACGITGIRGQAEAGFPAVRETALPVLRTGLSQGLSLNRAGAAALLQILLQTQDTSFLHRASPEICRAVTEQVRVLLEKDPYPDEADLLALDTLFIRHRLSPGGCADLLAGACFVHFLLIDTDRFSGIMEEEIQ